MTVFLWFPLSLSICTSISTKCSFTFLPSLSLRQSLPQSNWRLCPQWISNREQTVQNCSSDWELAPNYGSKSLHSILWKAETLLKSHAKGLVLPSLGDTLGNQKCSNCWKFCVAMVWIGWLQHHCISFILQSPGPNQVKPPQVLLNIGNAVCLVLQRCFLRLSEASLCLWFYVDPAAACKCPGRRIDMWQHHKDTS
jgi:hypothetical protein